MASWWGRAGMETAPQHIVSVSLSLFLCLCIHLSVSACVSVSLSPAPKAHSFCALLFNFTSPMAFMWVIYKALSFDRQQKKANSGV